MKAEIISIGSELTSGQNLDTNCQFLSRRLAEIGIPVGFHTTVADDLQDNIEVFRIAAGRADLVLATGGLGPTQDDLTREAIAASAGVGLWEDAGSIEHIREMFARRGRVMPERNRVQGLFPEGAEPLFNRVGTAPGVWFQRGEKIIAAMPGVPSEMFIMFDEQIKPRLAKLGKSSGVLIQRKINTFGMGESAVEEKLIDITRRGHVPEVGITVSDAIISLRILARAATHEEAHSQISPIEALIRERLGELVFGSEEEELHEVVVRLLKEKRQTIAVAEGVTAGLLGHCLGLVPGASEVYRGGIIAYDNRWKINYLGVPASLIETHGAVSAEVAQAMADGCRLKFGTDLALATVGIAGPDGGSEENPVGTVFVALSGEGLQTMQKFSWIAPRHEVHSRTAKLALNLARLHLRN